MNTPFISNPRLASTLRVASNKKLLALLVATSLMTACGGSDDDYTTSTGEPAGLDNEVGQSVSPATASSSLGDLLVDEDGLTLYTFDNDTEENKSVCIDGCAQNWPPLIASSQTTLETHFTTFERDDEGSQWAYNGDPLYRFVGDNVSGDVSGEGIGGTWHIARPNPVSAAGSPVVAVGNVLTPEGRIGKDGFTLYTFDNDGVDESNCNDGCAQTWPPLLADDGATAVAPYSIIQRDNGDSQWAINGQPLYFFGGDTKAGDETGDGLGGVWHSAES